MGIYSKFVLPKLTHLSMGQAQLRPYRSRVVGGARGKVLEIGFGTGRNLPYYPDHVEEVIGVEPSPEMLALAASTIAGSTRSVKLLERSAESLPLGSQSVDTVVVTWSLCSIPNPSAALREIRRVLRTSGQLRFVEHGLAPDASVRKWQDRLTPLWSYCAGGCHLNRKTDDLIRAAGLRLVELTTAYARGPRFTAHMYEGVADHSES